MRRTFRKHSLHAGHSHGGRRDRDRGDRDDRATNDADARCSSDDSSIDLDVHHHDDEEDCKMASNSSSIEGVALINNAGGGGDSSSIELAQLQSTSMQAIYAGINACCELCRLTMLCCGVGCCAVDCCMRLVGKAVAAHLKAQLTSSNCAQDLSMKTTSTNTKTTSSSESSAFIIPSVITLNGARSPQAQDSVALTVHNSGGTRTARCSVAGMTCADCSLQVETRLKSLEGVVRTQVSCLTHEALVEYDPQQIGAAATIVDSINSTGFVGRLMCDMSTDEFMAQGQGASDELLAKFELKQLILSTSDVPVDSQRVQDTLSPLPGVISVGDASWKTQRQGSSTSVRTALLDVRYDAAQTGPRALLSAMHGLGIEARVLSSRELAIGGDHAAAAVVLWQTRMLVGVVFAIPVLFLTVLVPDAVLGASVEDFFATEIVDGRPGLTLRTFLCILLGLPILTYAGSPLVESAWRAARYAHSVNMDTLVVLSSLVAWVFSFGIVVAKLSGANTEDKDFFETPALLIAIIAIGRWLEAVTKGQASKSLEELAVMQASTAVWLPFVNAREDACCSSGDGHAHGGGGGHAKDDDHGHARGGKSAMHMDHDHDDHDDDGHDHDDHDHVHDDDHDDHDHDDHGHAHGAKKGKKKAAHAHGGAGEHTAEHGHGYKASSCCTPAKPAAASCCTPAKSSAKSKALGPLVASAEHVAAGISADGTYDERYEHEIDLSLLHRGDIVKVTPGSKVPTDGVVLEGSSQIDESTLTGESRPISKVVGNLVYGGTINQHGTLVVRVTKVASENMLSSIGSLVRHAQSSKPDVQRYADQVSGWFVPSIVVLSFSVFFIWLGIAVSGSVHVPHDSSPVVFALFFALSTLVVSCPCAIGLAVPTAIMVGTGIAAKLGILFKGGVELESLHKVNVMVFDKTGTLTCGSPRVTHVALLVEEGQQVDRSGGGGGSSVGLLSRRDFWFLLGSAESASEHPLAKAVTAHARKQLDVVHDSAPFASPSEFTAMPGLGIVSVVAARKVIAGTLAHVRSQDQESSVSTSVCVPADVIARIDELERSGHTSVYVAIDDQFVGALTLADEARPEARSMVRKLGEMGVEVWMMSGDQQQTAMSVGRELGIDEERVMGGLMPSDKVERVRRLQQLGHVVAMVGDGINDSPALAQAHVGIGMASGTAIALSSSAVVLLHSNLEHVLIALSISRATFQRIRWNFGWAFIYNVVAVIFAAGLLYSADPNLKIPPAYAGLSELLSSLPVIVISLMMRLEKFERVRPAHEQ